MWLDIFKGLRLGWSWALGSGYSDTENAARLLAACKEVVTDPAFDPIIVNGELETHCNLGVYAIFEKMGWGLLLPLSATHAPLMANDLIEWLNRPAGPWRIGTGTEAWQHANEGRPTISGEQHAGHGHVTVICPSEQMGYSASLQRLVPYCANVGKNDEIELVSQAFPVAQGEPTYFLYTGPEA